MGSSAINYEFYNPNNENLLINRSIKYDNARIEQIEQKKLYVDLSNSKIPSNFIENSNAGNLQLLQSVTDLERRRRSISDDSRIFDCSNSTSHFCLDYKMNYNQGRMCASSYGNGRSQNTWTKYCYGMALLGSLYIIILVVHQGELIRNINKHIEIIKLDVDNNLDTETRIVKLEALINSIKKEQESRKMALKDLISSELEIFSADKTGRTDFAMESSGGKIVALTPGTENFDYAKTLFGITLCEGMHGPRAMLQTEMHPGHCWAFKGSRGGAVIKLIGKVRIDAVSLEHISEGVSPSGEITSAPKDFIVSGMNNPTDNGKKLGQFTYDIFDSQLQMFGIHNNNYYEYVEFKVLSNYENPAYTCVYRFRVHGTLHKH
ncbi:unnamed protein product [Psylliodes chrysocephalus]|uniref:SUN domain-containing protein n=1 Tax=Psylliodes chrysocephalus TaxID=3402493 RepID=A0A9P0G5K6_9CUCU|nr:unnamed protein product [Psylliodes chrysocephala]